MQLTNGAVIQYSGCNRKASEILKSDQAVRSRALRGSEVSETKHMKRDRIPCNVLFCLSGKEHKMQKLSHAAAGSYTVKWIFTEPDLKQILKDLCIEVGKEITVISNSFGQILLRSEAGAFVIEADAALGVTV